MYARHVCISRLCLFKCIYNTSVPTNASMLCKECFISCLLPSPVQVTHPQEMNYNISRLLLCSRLDQTACRMMIMLGGKREFWGGLIADTTLLQCAICDIPNMLHKLKHSLLPILGASELQLRPKE